MVPLRLPNREDRFGGVRVSYDLTADGKDAVDVLFRVEGEWSQIEGLDEAPLALGARRDELWKTTCFELFYGPPNHDEYGELNFSPRGDWATYVFDGERRGMRPGKSAPTAPFKRTVAGGLELGFKLLTQDWHWGDGLRLLGTAVLVVEGKPTYWSANPCGEPADFHRDFNKMRSDAEGVNR